MGNGTRLRIVGTAISLEELTCKGLGAHEMNASLDTQEGRKSPHQTSFPERLESAVDRPRVLETSGFGPSLVAVPLIAWGAYNFANTPRASLGTTEIVVLVVLFACAGLLVRVDIRRRREGVVLVVEGRSIAVYRRGLLLGVMTAADLYASRAREGPSLKGLLGLAFVAIAFLGYGLTEEGGFGSRLAALAPGVYLIVLTLSLCRSAFLCECLYLPGSRVKSLFSSADLLRAGVQRPEE